MQVDILSKKIFNFYLLDELANSLNFFEKIFSPVLCAQQQITSITIIIMNSTAITIPIMAALDIRGPWWWTTVVSIPWRIRIIYQTNITLKIHIVRLQSVSAEALLNDVWWWYGKEIISHQKLFKNFKSFLSCKNN